MRPPERGDRGPRSLGYRLLWFVGLWIAGVVVVAAVAYAIRWSIMP